MEDSAFDALYTGTYVLVFIISIVSYHTLLLLRSLFVS